MISYALFPHPLRAARRLHGVVLALGLLSFAAGAAPVSTEQLPQQSASVVLAPSTPAGSPASADEMGSMVAEMQKQTIAQQALLQVLQARLVAQVTPSVSGEPPAAASPASGVNGAKAPAGHNNAAAPVVPPPVPSPTAPVTSKVLASHGSAATPVVVPPVTTSSVPLPTTDMLTTDAQRQAYASGVTVWREIESSILSQRALGIALDERFVMTGLQDAADHRPLKLSGDDMAQVMTDLNGDYIRRVNDARARQEAVGRDWRVTFSKSKGAFSDAGAWYRVDDKGTGRRLCTTDLVILSVTGSLPDGTMFDASGLHGQTKTVKVAALLPSVATGLQKVGVGGHLTVVVPPARGYGDAGMPPSIPGGATLIFDITVKGLVGHDVRG